MRKIGITGNIGSGKSTISEFFSVLGIPIYDADSRAKWLMNHQPDLKTQIQSLFGEQAYLPDESLNRKLIASIVFHDKSKIEALNALVHPAVRDDFHSWSLQQNTSYILKEAALLIESNSYQDLDEIILVTCPIETRIERTMKRDAVDRSAVEARIQNQMKEEDKIPYATYFINNDGTELIIPQVLQIHQQILEKTY
ncbi:MAG: dephospho-CoA kinase [Bacteroidia bacterium]